MIAFRYILASRRLLRRYCLESMREPVGSGASERIRIANAVERTVRFGPDVANAAFPSFATWRHSSTAEFQRVVDDLSRYMAR